MGVCPEKRRKLAAVGRTYDFHLTELAVLLYVAVFFVLSEQADGFGPDHIAVFVKGEVSFVVYEISVVVEGAHPLVDEVPVFVFEPREAAHCDDAVPFRRGAVVVGVVGVGTEVVFEVRPGDAVIRAVFVQGRGHRRIPAFSLAARHIRPAGTSRDEDEPLGAVGEVELVNGGCFFRGGERIGDRDCLPGQPFVAADAHHRAAFAVSERERGENVAVVEQHAVGMGEIILAGVAFVRDNALVVKILILFRGAFGHCGKVHESASALRPDVIVLVASRKRERQSEQQKQNEYGKFLFHISPFRRPDRGVRVLERKYPRAVRTD